MQNTGFSGKGEGKSQESGDEKNFAGPPEGRTRQKGCAFAQRSQMRFGSVKKFPML